MFPLERYQIYKQTHANALLCLSDLQISQEIFHVF